MRYVVPIVMASDEGYLPCAAVAIRSLIDTKKHDSIYHIYILCTGVSELARRAIEDMSQQDVMISFRDISDWITPCLAKLYTRAYFTKEMYFRWWIGELFPEYDKVLYLDCDIVATCDLSALYQTNLGGAAVGGVIDFATPAVVCRIAKQLHLQAEEYINSGVLLINTAVWRAEHLKDTCLAYLDRHEKLICPDQDVLNMVCRKRILYLNGRWNVQWHHLWDRQDNQLEEPFLSMFSFSISAPKILHFSSQIKPWNSPPNPYSNYFWQYAEPLGYYSKKE